MAASRPWTGPISLATLVISTSRIPHGTIKSNAERSVVTLRAKPCQVTHWRTWMPMLAILRPPVQTPVKGGFRSAATPRLARAPISASSSWRRNQCRSR
jgi:hypothetical protein